MGVGGLRVTITGATHDLAPGSHRVGRDPGCSVCVDDAVVSRHHADLVVESGTWTLVDAGSTGGTWLDGVRQDLLAVHAPLEVRLGHPDRGPLLGLRPGAEIAAPRPRPDGDAAPLAAPPPPPATAPPRRSTAVAAPPTDPGAVVPGRPAVEGPSQTAAAPSGIFTGRYFAPEHTTIGRDDANDIVVEGLLVSRRHAMIDRQVDGRLDLVDLGSRNGTFVNGARITRTPIGDGDLVSIGHATFRVEHGVLAEFVDTGLVTFAAHGLTVTGPGGRRLVDDVSLSLAERSLCAIVGPSGAGKSTLLSALSGLRPASRGTVLYGGRDLYAGYAELRNRIGMVPQEDILHRELGVQQALEYSARLRFPADVTAVERTDRIVEVLAELGLSHRAHDAIATLSGGERKRTSVALELLTKPSLLFLDEPASGLDPGLTRVLMRLLRALADDGRTIVVVTHEIDNLALCDQVVMMAPGGVLAYAGPPAEAAAHFGRDDLTDVFSDLATRSDTDWRADPPAPRPEVVAAGGSEAVAPPPPVRQQGWVSQVVTLCSRYAAVLAADRRNLALLVLQAPVLGVLMLAALPAGELGRPAAPEVRLVSTAGLVLFVLLLGATWLGANNSIREIARDLPVLRRERSVGLSLSAYVTSKVLVLATLTVLQVVVMVAIASARQRGPDDAVVLGWPLGELMAVVALAGVASMALGLLVSAVAKTPERATSILPMLLILQLVLSAGVILPEIGDRPGLRQLGYASSAQWGVAASASTVDLNDLQEYDQRLRDLRTVDSADPRPAVDSLVADAPPEARWAHTLSAWATAMGAMALLTLASVLATILALRRDRPDR